MRPDVQRRNEGDPALADRASQVDRRARLPQDAARASRRRSGRAASTHHRPRGAEPRGPGHGVLGSTFGYRPIATHASSQVFSTSADDRPGGRMNTRTHGELANFIWSICNLLRGHYK